MTPQEIIKQFVKLFADYESRKIENLGDNLHANFVTMTLYPDGSGKIMIDTLSSVHRPDATPTEKLLHQIMGSGEMEVEFENVDELTQILTQGQAGESKSAV